MFPTEHMLEGSNDMTAHDTFVSIEVLDRTEVPHPNTARGMKEISVQGAS